jgi:SAM-dependent methyltransferase
MTGPTTAHQSYTGAAGRQYHEGKRALDSGALDWVVRARAARFQPRIRPDHRVFEFGVGAGWNLRGIQCQRRVGLDIDCFLAPGWEAMGIEFTQDSRSLADQSFDVVLCHHALEHVDHPAETLVELRRVTQPNGRLLLAVPYEFERRYRVFDPNEPNHHLFSWNVQTMGNLLTVAGWKVESIKLGRYGYDRFAANWARRAKLGEQGFHGIRRILQWLKPCREIVAEATPANR